MADSQARGIFVNHTVLIQILFANLGYSGLLVSVTQSYVASKPTEGLPCVDCDYPIFWSTSSLTGWNTMLRYLANAIL